MQKGGRGSTATPVSATHYSLSVALDYPLSTTHYSLFLQPLPGAIENTRGLVVKEHKINGFERTAIPQMLRRFLQHDLRALLHRESRNAGADGRERNGLQPALRRKPQRM